MHPWHIPIDPIRDYFGEKIAIYFSFLTFYSKYKLIMAIIGVIIFILHKTFLGTADALAYKWTTFIYALLILIWSIIFSEQWKRRQKLFAIRYGQDNTDALTQKVIRSGFEGEYIRDKSTNEMNTLYYSGWKRVKKYFLTFSISFFIICLSVATSLAILLWKK